MIRRHRPARRRPLPRPSPPPLPPTLPGEVLISIYGAARSWSGALVAYAAEGSDGAVLWLGVPAPEVVSARHPRNALEKVLRRHRKHTTPGQRRCLRCGYVWLPRKKNYPPRLCPRCKQPWWKRHARAVSFHEWPPLVRCACGHFETQHATGKSCQACSHFYLCDGSGARPCYGCHGWRPRA